MKFKKILLTIAAVAAAVFCVCFSACNLKTQKGEQNLSYAESVEKIDNPDQGFYRPIYVRMTADGASYNKNIVNDNTRLYHLRIDISAFSSAVNGSADLPLTLPALDGLKEILTYLKGKDKNAIVRFAYDPSYNGKKDQEPSLDMIKTHIAQVCPIINSYQNTVTAIEVGLIGPWGEMHSSKIANAEHITPIIGCFLDNTQNIPVLVRTPKMIYNYLGITLNDIDDYTISANSKAYRLGLFNDGYLGSGSDLGTYSDRVREVEFLSKQTEHLPYGGEVVMPDSSLHDIQTCLPEMYQINLNYLNIEWNNQVIDKWKNSKYTKKCGNDKAYYNKTAFEYIQNHLGYRFVLTKSVFDLNDDKLDIELSLNNVGFGNLNKAKTAQIVFVGENGNVAFAKDLDTFSGQTSLSYAVDLNLANGNYDVYLRLYGEKMDDNYLYCLQFANDGLWNASLKANKIGSIEIAE